MSAGEGLDEAGKDAADIAAFFKSGKSEKGRVVCHIVAKYDKKQ